MQSFKRLWLVLAGLLAALAGPLARATEPPVLSFGIVPQQPAAKLAQTWAPVLAYLSNRTGYAIRFDTAKDIPTFEQRLAAGEYDIAYMNPYHYTVFSRQPGYRALARESNTLIKGLVVVRKDSPYQKPEDLAGKTLAFPAPAAFAATVLPLADFARQGISVKPRYVASHESVYLNVAQGLFPAGGGVVRTLEAMPPAIRDQLRILWTSHGYTPHAVAVHPRLAKATVDRLATALVGMADDDHGKALLAGINIKGFTTASDKDWDDVRQLRITNLDRLLKE
jgi:phosphonate transport system substrate-binding protein